MDGSHITVRVSKEKQDVYRCRKDTITVNLLAACTLTCGSASCIQDMKDRQMMHAYSMKRDVSLLLYPKAGRYFSVMPDIRWACRLSRPTAVCVTT